MSIFSIATASRTVKEVNINQITLSTFSSIKTKQSSTSMSSPSTGSTSSSTSQSNISSPGPVYEKNGYCLPKIDTSCIKFNNSYLDGSREMPVDCPEGFIPEVKSKPMYPSNFKSKHKNKNESYSALNTSSSYRVESIAPNTELNSNKYNLNSHEMSMHSFSSLQFIDEDTKSRLNLNSTTNTPANQQFAKKALESAQKTLLNAQATLAVRKELYQQRETTSVQQKVSEEHGNVNKCFESDSDELCIETKENNKLNAEHENAKKQCNLIGYDEYTKQAKKSEVANKLFQTCDIYEDFSKFKSQADTMNLETSFELASKDIFTINRIINENETQFFKKFNSDHCNKATSDLYSKIICLNSNQDFKPTTTHLTELASDLCNNNTDLTNELNALLTKPHLKRVLYIHDQISVNYEKEKSIKQSVNKEFYINQKQGQSNMKRIDSPVLNCTQKLILNEKESMVNKNDQTLEANGEELTEEGRYLLSKANHYAVDNLKLVNIEKNNAPLGATIKNQDGNILISRVVIGGVAYHSKLLHEHDEILEINNIPVRGRTINDVCDLLSNIEGVITFLIIPNICLEGKIKIPNDTHLNTHGDFYLRALFNYTPIEDLYIPCKELGLTFQKADILKIINKDEEDWWQAYKIGDKEQYLAGLIPSISFQERRFSQMNALFDESLSNKKYKKSLQNFQKNSKNKKKNEANIDDSLTYEEVVLYKPPPYCKRPIVLIGPHSIGRHELRKRIMQSNPLLFEAATPHTTRPMRKDEFDGKEYHFIPRHIFEADIKQGRFIEYGEYEKNLYGTSRESIKKVIQNSKVCVLNLYPQALKALHATDLMPYVIYIGPPNLTKLKELKQKSEETFKEKDFKYIIDKGREIEELYGHYFDKIIRNYDTDATYNELIETIYKVQEEENWIPKVWLKN